MTDASPRQGIPLHTKILSGLVLGAVLGVACNAFFGEAPALTWVVKNIAQPVGQVFLRMLLMVTVPLVFASLTLGVASLGDVSRIGRVGGRTLLAFLATTSLAVLIGLITFNLVRPGERMDAGTRDALIAEYSTQGEEKVEQAATGGFGVGTFVNIVPRNPVAAAASGDMLALIFFSLVFGIALTKIPEAASKPVIDLLDGIGKAVSVMIDFAMRLAPYGVFGLIFAVTAKLGYQVLATLLVYVVMVLIALAVHQFVVLGALGKWLTGLSPVPFFRKLKTLMVTAFSTSSSNATMPATMRAAQSLGVPAPIAGFVVPLGATMNMNGTAMFEGMTVLFLAQVFAIDLPLAKQVAILILAVVTSIGVAGVPGGSIPLIVLVLGLIGVPPEGIALILGVDRILDMSRTVPNVTGDVITALWVSKKEGVLEAPPSSA